MYIFRNLIESEINVKKVQYRENGQSASNTYIYHNDIASKDMVVDDTKSGNKLQEIVGII